MTTARPAASAKSRPSLTLPLHSVQDAHMLSCNTAPDEYLYLRRGLHCHLCLQVLLKGKNL